MSESGLIRRAQRGDVDALEELCAREWRPVYTMLFHTVGDPTEAQDLTQEVFLRALRSLDRYEDRGVPFRAYLMTIARNLAKNHWRTMRRKSADIENASGILAQSSDPEELALRWDRLADLQAGLDELSEDHRRVLELRVVDGLSAAEVGRRMNRSADAVRQLQRRALLALQAALTESVEQ